MCILFSDGGNKVSVSKRVVLDFMKGDQVATGEVFEEYKNLLYFIITTYVSNSNDCDDLLSETFLKAMQHRNDIKNPPNIKSFLSKIAKNEALQFLRKNKTVVLEHIDEIYGQDDVSNPLLDMFGPLLDNRETIIVYYRAVFSFSWKEIATETGIPESTSKAIYKTAKEKLRKELL